jgi:carbon monoxide dehydrogenase subunit G
MKLEQSFEVAAPIETVWDALIDIERVAPCLPGASVTGRNEDGSYTGALTIKIGPTTAAYAGKLEMEQIDEGAHVAVMQAQGTDKRGQGGAKATISSTLSASEGGTKVDVVTDYHITGRLARFGRGGMIEDISERLLREFAQCLQSTLVGRQQAPAPSELAAATVPAGSDGAVDGDQPSSSVAVSAAEAGTVTGAEAVTAAAPGGGTVTGESSQPPSPSASAASQPPPAQPAAAAPQPPPQSAPQPSQPLNAMPLVAGVVKDRARQNPVPVGAILLGLLLVLFVLRRRSRH